MSEPRVPKSLSVLLCAGLTACAVGPNFKPSKPPGGSSYFVPDKESSGLASDTPGAKAPQAVMGGELAAAWWQVFHCAPLDDTLKRAIAGSPTLAQAQATLEEARQQVLVAQAAFLPKLGATAGVTRQNTASELSPTGPSNLYSVGLSASYALDVFGGTRRSVEQQRALAQMQIYELGAAWLTLTGDVVTQALTIASTRLQIATTLELIDEDRRNLQLTQHELDAGAAAQTDVLTAEAQLVSDEASLPPLRQQLGAARDALAVLVGEPPGEWAAPDFDIDQLTLPQSVPVSMPATLVRRRPDILAAEAQLHAASAAIGVAVAQEFPSLTLTGSLAREALTPGNVFKGSSLVSGGAGLTAPLFEGGALRAQAASARAAFAVQQASYRNTVLTGLQQVADDLRALDNDAAHVAASRRSMEVSRESLDLQRKSYEAGKSTILQLIDAERTYAQARLSLATAQIQQFQDLAGLFVALGGGWEQNPSSAPQPLHPAAD